MTVSDDSRLWDLLDKWDDHRKQGHAVSAEDLCHDCPELLAQVKDHMQALTAMAWLNKRSDEDDSNFSKPNQAGDTQQEGMPPMTPQALVECLSQSGLLALTDIEALVQSHPPESSSVEALAQELVNKNKLTSYQVSLLCEGKWQGLILGEYTITDQIGAGGMGQVFKALHRRMDRIVALKVLPKETTASPAAIRRFHHEVKAAAKLSHPNIVTAHDAGEQEGVHYLVMEYIEGTDLARLVKEHGSLPVDKAVAYILQAARGLEFAHGKGVIHRDIKPANLLLNTEGTVKILDMGLARIQLVSTGGPVDEQSGITKSGTVMGTVDYMAPEQALDAATVDRRADIYSLGCTFYFLLTGKPLYTGDNSMQRFVAHRESPIPSLQTARPEVTEAFDKVFRRMVAKKPEDRFPSMSGLIEALATCPVQQKQPATGSHTQVLKSGLVGEGTQSFEKPQSAPSGLQTSAGARPKGMRWLGVPVGIVVLGLLGFLFVPGVIFRVKTAAGTVVVEVDQPGAEVAVDGKQITITRPGDEAVKIEVEEGKHELTVTKGGFKTTTEQFTLKSGATETIRVRLERAEVKIGKLKDADFDKWLKDVAALPAEKQVEAVGKKLQELNPGFDGKVTHKVENGVVKGLSFVTDKVTDISPVRALTKLQSLDCGGSHLGRGKLSDLSPLKDMKLTLLSFQGNQVSDLSPLTNMPLTAFNCGDTQVANLSPLTGMKLAYLDCNFTKVSDLSPLKGMPLFFLSCYSTPVSDLSPLKDLKLAGLVLRSTQVSDLSPLKRIPLNALLCDFKPFRDTEILRSIKSLEKINDKPVAEFWKEVEGQQAAFEAWCKDVAALPAEKQVEAVAKKLQELNPGFDGKVTHVVEGSVVTGLTILTDMTDISAVRALKGLQALTFFGTPGKGRLSDLSPLKDMKLTSLAMRFAQVADLSPLKDMKLTYLAFQDTKVSDLSPLKGMPLTHLNCNGTPVSDLSPLKEIPLTHLWCGDTRVADLSPLKGMKLIFLTFQGTNVSDLTPLSGMPLTSLACGRSKVSDLSPLKGMKLTELACAVTKVSDLSPLKGMPLTSLECRGTHLSDLSPLKGMPLKELWCDFKSERDTEILKSIKTLEKINDKPAAEFWKEVDEKKP